MSEAVKQDMRPGADNAYNTPLEDLDPSNALLWQNEEYWPIFERLRNEDPLHWCKAAWESGYRSDDAAPIGPYWSVTRYEDIMAIDTDHKRFSSEPSIVLPNQADDFSLPMFIAMDQPKHDVQRKTVAPIVSPMSLGEMSKLIRERTQYVLDQVPIGEEFDWVDTVSIELTTMMLATLFDFPFEDRHLLTLWSDMTTATEGADHFPGQEKRVQHLIECLEYFTELREKRANGAPSFDLVSMMARDPNTKDMDAMNFLGNLLLLIVGGNDTTRNSMSASINAWNRFPDEFTKLRDDPSLIDNMVAEVIRWQTPLSHMRRTALEDVEMGGKTIKKGDKVVMWYYSGNHDEDMFDDPRTIKFDRHNVKNHLSFGFGIHRCMGLRVAELQLRILWQQILEKFEKIELVEEPTRLKSNFVNGYTDMQVQVTRR